MLTLLLAMLGVGQPKLVRAEPAAGARLRNPPSVIRLWLSPRPDLAATTVRLLDATGAVVPTGPVARDTARDTVAGAPLVVPVGRILFPGAYTVAWRTRARGGRAVSGHFGFTVFAPVMRGPGSGLGVRAPAS